MRIRLTIHATRQLPERCIPLEWVEQVITCPGWRTSDPDPALTRAYDAVAGFGDRILRVVYRVDGDEMVVVTAHFDRGATQP